jgi:hypothetical protein
MAMRQVLQDEDLRTRMIHDGRIWALSFSWQETAKMT